MLRFRLNPVNLGWGHTKPVRTLIVLCSLCLVGGCAPAFTYHSHVDVIEYNVSPEVAAQLSALYFFPNWPSTPYGVRPFSTENAAEAVFGFLDYRRSGSMDELPDLTVRAVFQKLAGENRSRLQLLINSKSLEESARVGYDFKNYLDTLEVSARWEAELAQRTGVPLVESDAFENTADEAEVLTDIPPSSQAASEDNLVIFNQPIKSSIAGSAGQASNQAYQVALPNTASGLSARLTSSDDLDLELRRGGSSELLASAQGQNGEVLLNFPDATPGNYEVEVVNNNQGGASVPYEITVRDSIWERNACNTVDLGYVLAEWSWDITSWVRDNLTKTDPRLELQTFVCTKYEEAKAQGQSVTQLIQQVEGSIATVDQYLVTAETNIRQLSMEPDALMAELKERTKAPTSSETMLNLQIVGYVASDYTRVQLTEFIRQLRLQADNLE